MKKQMLQITNIGMMFVITILLSCNSNNNPQVEVDWLYHNHMRNPLFYETTYSFSDHENGSEIVYKIENDKHCASKFTVFVDSIVDGNCIFILVKEDYLYVSSDHKKDTFFSTGWYFNEIKTKPFFIIPRSCKNGELNVKITDYCNFSCNYLIAKNGEQIKVENCWVVIGHDFEKQKSLPASTFPKIKEVMKPFIDEPIKKMLGLAKDKKISYLSGKDF